MKKDFYIRLLEFGEKHKKGFSYSEIILSKNFTKNEKIIIETFIDNAFKNSQPQSKKQLSTPFFIFFGPNRYNPKDDQNKYILSFEAKFKHIDYLELQEMKKTTKAAQDNSQKAQKNARIAIWIAIISLFASITFSIIQIYQPIKLKNDQMQKIQELKFQPDSIEKKMNEISEGQDNLIEILRSNESIKNKLIE